MEEVIEGRDYSFPVEEEKILEFWDAIDAFQQQLKRSEGKKPYVFYDGPPFATGLPHYGHLLAGTLKVRSGYISFFSHYLVRTFSQQQALRTRLCTPVEFSQPFSVPLIDGSLVGSFAFEPIEAFNLL